MAVDDLSVLRDQLPEVFQERLPPGWDEDWLIIPIDDPELGTSSVEAAPDYETPDDTSAATLVPPAAWHRSFVGSSRPRA
jgi:hypothetical protein